MTKKPVTLAPVNTVDITPEEINLLQSIANATASEAGFLYVSIAASVNLVALGLVEINPSVSNADGIGTRVTPKGTAKLNIHSNPAPAHVSAPAAAKPAIAIDNDVALPVIKRNSGGNGSKAAYPFDVLEPNQSFHVTADGNDKLPRVIAAAVSNANARYAKPTGENETVTMASYQVDASGKRVKVNGHFVKTGEKQVTRPKMKAEREFVLRTVDANDIRGAGIRVFRVI